MSTHNYRTSQILPLLGREEELELARRARPRRWCGDRPIDPKPRPVRHQDGARLSPNRCPDERSDPGGNDWARQAIRKFNPEKDARLATYAKWWVRAAMQDHVVRSWSLVRLSTSSAQKSLFLQVRRLTSELLEGADALGDDIAARLADRFGTTATDVLNLARRVGYRDRSLDGPISSDGKECWLDQLPSDAPSPEEQLETSGERRALGELIATALSKLPPGSR